MKRIISLLLVVVMLVGVLASCGENTDDATTLATPKDIAISDTGLITWSAVENATSYIVKINDKTYTVTTTSYQVVEELGKDFTYSVTAEADGYTSSEASADKIYLAPMTPPLPEPSGIVVSVTGANEVRSGHTVTLSATVTGTQDHVVTWEVVEGDDYVEVDMITGEVTAKSGLKSDTIVVIGARSLADETVIGTRALTLIAPPTLTQGMLDEIAAETKLEFSGYVNVDLYEFINSNKFYMSSTTSIKTATDGEYWYAEYQDASTGATAYIYYKNDDGMACQVGVNFRNEEEYFPMLDRYGNEVTWKDAGLYNNFTGLKVSDFTFDEDGWRYVYSGSDETLKDRVVACANPYDFVAKDLALIIEEGAIIGISARSQDDYSIAQSYRAEQTLMVILNFGDTVEVPTITRFEHKDEHDILAEAITNMQNLTNYTLDFTESTTAYTGGYSYGGFVETITSETCYFSPFSIMQDSTQNYNRVPNGSAYGYHQVRPDLYNTFHADAYGGYYASRAYKGSVNQAKPTFDFAPEIFTQYYYDEETDTHTFYVDQQMTPVASTFYYGVGNDIQLYGIYATLGYLNNNPFLPYVTVKDGYIIDSGFYFYIGSIYGIVMIEYKDFGTAELPEGVVIDFTAREIPTEWNHVTIIDGGDKTGTTTDDVEVPAGDYFNTFFGDPTAADTIPFFGDVLGDTFGFGLTLLHLPSGSNTAKQSIVLYYDVPLDEDYGITSYIEEIGRQLLAAGYQVNAYGEYVKGDIVVSPIDSSLDLTIYIWKK